MASDTASKVGGSNLAEYEPLILVTRGDELPKKNYERKLHPTYETSIRIKNGGQKTSPHYVVKFYDQYRDLCEGLRALDIGEGLAIDIDAPFPLKYPKSYMGFTLTEQQLQHRCYLLNKWMGAIFANYHSFPTKAQLLISEFLSLNDNDAELEQNKELILAMLRRRKEILIAEGIINYTKTGVAAPANSGNANVPASLASSSAASPRLTSDALDQVNAQQGNRTGAIDKSMYGTGSGNNTAGAAGAGGGAQQDNSDAMETIVGGFLGVRVRKGAAPVKKKDDSKSHYSYETFLRLLPLAEVTYTQGQGKAEIDPTAYGNQVKVTQVVVSRAFDAYRELRNDLERVQVYSSDNPTDSSAARQNGYKVIVIDAPFPPTLTLSSLGVSLTDAQAQERANMMNSWLGILMKNFNVLPRDGKELITDFLGMPSVYSEQPTTATHYTIIHNILRGTYTPPKVPNTSTAGSRSPSAPKKTLISYFTRRADTPEPAANNSTALTVTDNATFDVSATRPNGQKNISDNESVLSGGDGMTDAGIEATSSEILVGSYLGVTVIRGRPVAKKAGEKKIHPSYEVLIRILPLEEALLPEGEKRRFDEDAYNVHVEAGPMRIAYVFDAYRTLKTDLEAFRVYSLDRKSEVDSLLAKNSNDPVVLVDARFPRTYQRQSLGFKLNDPQLNQRAVMLNQWFGMLMQSFHLLPFLAKELVVKFLSEPDKTAGVLVGDGAGLNPVRVPRDAIILSMLKQTYTPEYKKVNTGLFGTNGDGTAANADGKKKKKDKKNKKNKSGEEDEEGYVGGGGCAPGCTIM